MAGNMAGILQRRPSGGAPSLVGSGAPAYDPGDHKVGDVLDYVADHPDETSTVLAMERAGKARATIISALSG